MKILKSFSSSEYAKKRANGIPLPHFIMYGLGDNGKLYIKCRIYRHIHEEWVDLEATEVAISLEEMFKIIKAFNNLLPFI